VSCEHLCPSGCNKVVEPERPLRNAHACEKNL
jgi:hypothetical protein